MFIPVFVQRQPEKRLLMILNVWKNNESSYKQLCPGVNCESILPFFLYLELFSSRKWSVVWWKYYVSVNGSNYGDFFKIWTSITHPALTYFNVDSSDVTPFSLWQISFPNICRNIKLCHQFVCLFWKTCQTSHVL